MFWNSQRKIITPTECFRQKEMFFSLTAHGLEQYLQNGGENNDFSAIDSVLFPLFKVEHSYRMCMAHPNLISSLQTFQNIFSISKRGSS